MPPLATKKRQNERMKEWRRLDKRQEKEKGAETLLLRGKRSCIMADTSKDDCNVILKAALSGPLKDAKSVYLIQGLLLKKKKYAVYKLFSPAVTLFCKHFLFSPSCFFSFRYWKLWLQVLVYCILFLFKKKRKKTLFISILTFCAKKKVFEEEGKCW